MARIVLRILRTLARSPWFCPLGTNLCDLRLTQQGKHNCLSTLLLNDLKKGKKLLPPPPPTSYQGLVDFWKGPSLTQRRLRGYCCWSLRPNSAWPRALTELALCVGRSLSTNSMAFYLFCLLRLHVARDVLKGTLKKN